MKILHVVARPRSEGTPKLVLDWLEVHAHEQHVLFLENYENGILNKFPKDKTVVNERLLSGKKKVRQIINFVYENSLIIKPDMVIAWDTGFSQWILFGAKKAGVKKLLAHCGNAPGQSLIGKYLYTYLTFWSLKLIGAKVISCSKYVKNEFDKIFLNPTNNHYAVYNCINLAKFKPSDNEAKNVSTAIMVGTFEKHKDQRTLLEAWKIVEGQKENVSLNLVGGGALYDDLRNYSKELALKTVEFLGVRNDVPELLNSSDVFVFSTTPAEGFGTVLIEALASGLKIIATDVPACREVLANGEYGELIKPNDPMELATSIITAFENKITVHELEKNLKYADIFSAQHMMQQYLKIAEHK